MNKNNIAFLTIALLLATLHSPIATAEDKASGDAACQAFEAKRADFTKSLGKDETGKPMASEKSVQIAWQLIGAAADCFAERSVEFDRISTYAVQIKPDKETEPGKTAALVEEWTDGAVIYDVGYFVRKPYAAGGFEPNILFLPHSAVLGKLDMVTRHELTHARAHSLLLKNDYRLRHLWIWADDGMYVDEVLAYAEGGINDANVERMRTWSLDMARQYIAGTRKLLDAPQAEVATLQEGKRCPMSPALREEVSEMLACIEGVINSENAKPDQVALCDGQRAQASVCGM